METTSKQPNMNLMEEDNKITIVPYKKRYLQIFKGKSYYLLDRYKYDQNAIMMLLDLNKINKLGDIFVNYPDGIEKIKFIQIMKAELPSNPNDPMDETNLIYGLYAEKLFKKISSPFGIDKRSTIQTTVSNKESDIKSKTFFNVSSMRNKIMLPYIKEKIIFKKGETDKLLNYEF